MFFQMQFNFMAHRAGEKVCDNGEKIKCVNWRNVVFVDFVMACLLVCLKHKGLCCFWFVA